ncbi:MAG TPA: DNA polymerase/3'-5' exonuclease PolX [Gemmataceae bacterium]|jgi:DNA polymerase (family 10)|nr:DNA polymerase/3'-5' exonuclease PolX [Gemmataceae bacterium]
MTKEDIAAAFQEYGQLLELKGEPSFRTNSYAMAARALLSFEGDFAGLVASGRISEIPGIGSTLKAKIEVLSSTGKLPQLEALRAEIPPGLIQMLRIPGLGPKKVKAIYDQLHIETLDELKTACVDSRVAGLKGFGAKTQAKILEGLRFVAEVGTRVRIDQGLTAGAILAGRLRAVPGVVAVSTCGSVRRRQETVGNVGLLVSCVDPMAVLDAFAGQAGVIRVVERTENSVAVRLGIAVDGTLIEVNADVRVVSGDEFPVTLVQYTGSKAHVEHLRNRAVSLGFELTESQLTKNGKPLKLAEEEDVYDALGLPYIPPELREDSGEIEAAAEEALPRLVDVADIRGVLHNHTTYSDGSASLKQMALACKELGLEYFGVGDHSQSLKIARGLPPEAVYKQHAEIDALNRELDGVRILKGTECDILENGTLDYPDEILRLFDYVVVSVHTLFNLSREEMTARVCKALVHPATTILGHATGRLLLRREGYKIDLDAVLQCAAEHGKMIEINAQPMRLDLDWKYVRKAKAMGIPIVINPDAHSEGELALFAFGVDVARRGWLEAKDVFNTRPINEVIRELERRRSAARS